MTDSAKTPASVTPTPAPAASNLPAQALSLLRQIQDGETADGVPPGGVTLGYSPTAITGTFTFPIQRQPTPEGESVVVINFLK